MSPKWALQGVRLNINPHLDSGLYHHDKQIHLSCTLIIPKKIQLVNLILKILVFFIVYKQIGVKRNLFIIQIVTLTMNNCSNKS